jgi:tRNA G18 (ribose-2'-O)-methylase SpoU
MKVPPFGMPTSEIKAELSAMRSDMSIAICRAKNAFNVGAMIRVAHSFLVKEIFLIGTEPWYERAAMGMKKYETVIECADEASFLEKAGDRPLVGVERDHATTSIWECEMPKDLVFLFGSEDHGVPPELLAKCREVIAIPMYGINHSYPVTVASGMVLCEWARRRDPRARGR